MSRWYGEPVILGISTSGRTVERDEQGRLLKGVTEDLVKFILDNTGEDWEYVTLNGKNIRGCQACLRCASDNVCKLVDDWAEIRDLMLKSEAIVFGSPIYYSTINALGHSFLERLFSFRHRERFSLMGKPNVIVTVGKEEPNAAEDYIRRIFRSNYMTEPIGVLRSKGVAQCYTCGFGKNCAAGAVVSRHGFLDEIKSHHIPIIPATTYQKAKIIAQRLGSVVRKNRK
jgi:multimeric flavodoxin WrbA